MKKSGKSRVNARWVKAKWKAFVVVHLNDTEKAFVKKNLLQPEACLEFIRDMAERGYKVSWSYSPPEDVHTVSLTGVYEGNPNAGLTMSIRHREYEVAITALSWCATEDGLQSDWTERWSVKQDDNW